MLSFVTKHLDNFERNHNFCSGLFLAAPRAPFR